MDIRQRTITTLKDFYALMAETAVVRRAAVDKMASGSAPDASYAEQLGRALDMLQAIEPGTAQDTRKLAIDASRAIDVELGYEITELEKDILFLTKGESALMKWMSANHPKFDEEVRAGLDALAGLDFNCFISDRDGTTNNYCGRYLSSVQSAYNALFLTRFATSEVNFPVMLTSAPLADPGIVDVSVGPANTMIYAASKGREFIGLDGKRQHFPIEPEKQALLDTLNAKLGELVKDPAYEKFSLIGSGLQFKFGQSTVARQDIGKSVDESESEAFLAKLREITASVDSSGENFRIEDTGLDVEIILTIDEGPDGGGGKDFDKGDGVRFLNDALSMNMESGPHLICGDTGSDVPMLEAAMDFAPDTRAIFVTQKSELADRVFSVCPKAVVVSRPDVLVTILNTLQ